MEVEVIELWPAAGENFQYLLYEKTAYALLDKESAEKKIGLLYDSHSISVSYNLFSVWLCIGFALLAAIFLAFLFVLNENIELIGLFSGLISLAAFLVITYAIMKTKTVIYPGLKNRGLQIQDGLNDIISMAKEKGKDKTEKQLILWFDNIDRCTPDILASTISQFRMSLSKKAKYVIAADESVIRHAFSSVVAPGYPVDDIPRKLFDHTIVVPTLRRVQITKFISDILSKNDLEYPMEAKSAIWQAKIRNPRLIKKIIERIEINRTLVKQRTSVGIDTISALYNNDDYLPVHARLAVISEKWPSFFSACQANIGLLDELDDEVRRGDGDQAESTLAQTCNDNNIIGQMEEIKQYLFSTTPAYVGICEKLISCCGTVPERSAVNEDILYSFLVNGEVKESTDYLERISDGDSAELLRWIEQLVGDCREMRVGQNDSKKSTFITVLMNLWGYLRTWDDRRNEELFGKVTSEIRFAAGRNYKLLTGIDLVLLAEVIGETSLAEWQSDQRNGIRSLFIERLIENEQRVIVLEILSNSIEFRKIIGSDVLSKVSIVLGNEYLAKTRGGGVLIWFDKLCNSELIFDITEVTGNCAKSINSFTDNGRELELWETIAPFATDDQRRKIAERFSEWLDRLIRSGDTLARAEKEFYKIGEFWKEKDLKFIERKTDQLKMAAKNERQRQMLDGFKEKIRTCKEKKVVR